MANFVEILRNMLHRGPPQVPSVAAVDLLVATAQLQRYLQVRAGGAEALVASLACMQCTGQGRPSGCAAHAVWLLPMPPALPGRPPA